MTDHRVKRLRIFAGPNGSGKSSLYDYLTAAHVFHPYYHINPDVIAREMPVSFDMSAWPIDFNEAELRDFLGKSSFQSLVSSPLSDLLVVSENRVSLRRPFTAETSYVCAAFADFLRREMLRSGSSFSFETVFSHPSKLDEISAAKDAGFTTYLYVIATADPKINISRIKNRVAGGGHDVPEEKTKARYDRFMNLLYQAFDRSDRVFFFDNSDSGLTKDKCPNRFFAEKKSGVLTLSDGRAPEWFERYILAGLRA